MLLVHIFHPIASWVPLACGRQGPARRCLHKGGHKGTRAAVKRTAGLTASLSGPELCEPRQREQPRDPGEDPELRHHHAGEGEDP